MVAHWWMSVWYQGKWARYGLIPFALLYGCVMRIRRYLYQWGIKKTTDLKVPVIVIGNLTVGGTGKTPLTLCLAKYLMDEGYQVGIVSRGYKGRYTQEFEQVYPESSPGWVGDEAVLLARNIHCPIVVARKRVLGALFLQDKFGCNVILTDDGLQHYALGRQLEIIVIDGERRFGNQWMLPAGPLREPLSRLKSVDFCVANGQAQPGEFSMKLVSGDWVNLKNPSLKFTREVGVQIHAVTGIGNPDRFFDQLTQMGLEIIRHPFPDHHCFRKEELDFEKEAVILMTEKDAVKCFEFADERYWYLPVSALMDPEFRRLFITKLGGIVKNFESH